MIGCAAHPSGLWICSDATSRLTHPLGHRLYYELIAKYNYLLSNIQDGETQPFTFLPGQWLDVHIPSIPQAGGFTITSTPADAQVLPSPEPPEELADRGEDIPSAIRQGREPYVELAVQKSPSNPPAAWLWKPKEEILGKELNIRVGGSFVWPPTGLDTRQIKNVVFIAGGVGIK